MILSDSGALTLFKAAYYPFLTRSDGLAFMTCAEILDIRRGALILLSQLTILHA